MKKSEAGNFEAATKPPGSSLSASRAGRSPAPLGTSLLVNAPVPILLAGVWLLGAYAVTPERVGGDVFEVVMQVGVAVVMAVSLQLINGFSGQFSLGHAGFMAVGAYLSGYPSVAHSQNLSDPGSVLLFYVALFVAGGIAAVVLYGLFMLARLSGKAHRALPPIVMVLLFAWVVFDLSRAAKYTASGDAPPPPGWLIASRGIGLLQDLYGAILAHGAGVAIWFSGILPEAMRTPVCFVILLIGGGICAAAAGLIVGLPTLRLRGDYLAIATLGFAEIIRVGILNAEPLGGALGLTGIPTLSPTASFAWIYGCALVTIVVIWRIAYSGKGRAIQAVREDEIAAAAVGVDPTHHKVISFVVGSFFAGVGGVLYAHYTGFITPSPQEFGLVRSIEFVTMVTLGGLASISGAVLAAVVLTLLPEVLRNVSKDVVEWRMVIYSALLIAMMLLRPQGLLGGKELWPRRRRARRTRANAPREVSTIHRGEEAGAA